MAPRILIADDEPQLHAAYRDCFAVRAVADDELAALGAELFGGGSGTASGASGDNPFADYRFDYVSQGEDAVERIKAAQEAGDPYAALFLDMRMPPGINGLETARRVRELDTAINIVVVAGYSDHNPQKIAKVAGPLDKLYIYPNRSARSLCSSWRSRWPPNGRWRQNCASPTSGLSMPMSNCRPAKRGRGMLRCTTS